MKSPSKEKLDTFKEELVLQPSNLNTADKSLRTCKNECNHRITINSPVVPSKIVGMTCAVHDLKNCLYSIGFVSGISHEGFMVNTLQGVITVKDIYTKRYFLTDEFKTWVPFLRRKVVCKNVRVDMFGKIHCKDWISVRGLALVEFAKTHNITNLVGLELREAEFIIEFFRPSKVDIVI